MSAETGMSRRWKECLQHVKFWRNEVKRSMGEPINQVEIVDEPDGQLKIYGLANTSEDTGAQQKIVYVDLSKKPAADVGADDELAETSAKEPGTLVLKSLFTGHNIVATGIGEKPSSELCLLYERQRGQIVSGITSFSIANNTFLLTSPRHLHLYKNDKLLQIGSYARNTPLNAAFSPVDSNYVAFASKGQLFIDKHNECVFKSDTSRGTTSGVASFIVQEEFERYEGFWWSPTRVEILYEVVDESNVDELTFAVPGSRAGPESQMRYPRAGRTNSSSTLMICHVNVQHNLNLNLTKQANLHKVVPWYEYLVRCGWTHDGENVWAYVMDRCQTRAALLLLPRIVFCNEIVQNAEAFVKILYEEKSDNWINCNNLIQFLPNEPDGKLRAILGSEKRNCCHLYLHIFDLTYEDPVKLDEIQEHEALGEFTTSGGVPSPTLQISSTPSGASEQQFVRTAQEIGRPLEALPNVSPIAPPMNIVQSDEILELAANPPPMPPSFILPGPTERRSSFTSRRHSQQLTVLTGHRELPITDVDEDWSVYKETLLVDFRRQHVYYVCDKLSPTLSSLAVSSYGIPSRECRVLTPENLCCRHDRSHTTLNLNPDHGFVCWLSNSQTLPECRFYRLVHKCDTPRVVVDADVAPQSSPAELPVAVFAYRIGVEMVGLNPLAAIMPPPAASISGDEIPIASIGAQQQSGSSSSEVTKKNHAAKRTRMKDSFSAAFNRPSKYMKMTELKERVLASSAAFRQLSIGQPTMHRTPASLFHSRVFAYASPNDNDRIHYALLLWPTNAVMQSLGAKAVAASAKKPRAGCFPVLQTVYAGPSTQMAKDNWSNVANYLKFIAVGFAVLFVDGRGSANRGIDFEAPIKNALGTVELEDQVEGLEIVARECGDQLLDTSRVVVMGWSYGGYVAVLLLANYGHVYRAACAGGAVSDWTLYDTAYTERYLGEPQKHEAEYCMTALQAHFSKLPDEDDRLLLVHGLLDENVHFRHTEKLINGLIAHGKPHQLLLLPNERHSIRSGDAIEYFQTRTLVFFLNALSS